MKLFAQLIAISALIGILVILGLIFYYGWPLLLPILVLILLLETMENKNV